MAGRRRHARVQGAQPADPLSGRTAKSTAGDILRRGAANLSNRRNFRGDESLTGVQQAYRGRIRLEVAGRDYLSA